MKNKTTAATICIIAVVQAGLAAGGGRIWVCPFFLLTGCPCPGCGLSRASVALLRGDWRLSLTLHAFAPLLIVALILLGCSLLLPSQMHKKLGDGIKAIERRTGLTTILLIGLLAYWIIRIFFFR